MDKIMFYAWGKKHTAWGDNDIYLFGNCGSFWCLQTHFSYIVHTNAQNFVCNLSFKMCKIHFDVIGNSIKSWT